MTHPSLSRSIFALGILSLVGAGCPSLVPPIGVRPSQTVVAKQGFGKLPVLSPLGIGYEAGSRSAVSVPTPAPTAPLIAKDQAVGSSASSGSGVASPTMVRPVPYPYPYPQPHPVTVEYLLEGTMPSWGAEGDVLRAVRAGVDPSTLASIGSKAGVPAMVLNGATQVTSFSAAWKDANAFQWGWDSGSNTLNFWKNIPYAQPDWKTFPTYQKEELIAIAKTFLAAHGFDALASQTPDIQEWPQILPMMGKSISATAGMPCRYYGDVMMKGGLPVETVNPAVDPAGTDAAPAPASAPTPATEPAVRAGASSIAYPYPCGGWTTQVTLVYPASHEGTAVTDAYGNPASNATITISLATKEVTGGYVQLEGTSERSAYPLIDADAAKRRLQSGGRNPVYAYGEKNIVVHLKTIALVWMRYDSWKNDTHETYDLPALLATGTVDRGIKDQPAEDYRTIVPLLKDDSFVPDQGIEPPILYEGGGVPLPAAIK